MRSSVAARWSWIALVALVSACAVDPTEDTEASSDASDEDASASVALAFKQWHDGPSDLSFASHMAPTPPATWRFNVCVHNMTGSNGWTSTNIYSTGVTSALARWWMAVPSRLFPAGHVASTAADVHSVIASVADGSVGLACPEATKWNLHVYVTPSAVPTSPEAADYTFARDAPTVGLRAPRLVIPAGASLDLAALRRVIMHGIGHQMGLADTFVPGGGKNGCLLRADGSPHSPSIMCDASGLTSDDYRAAQCLYCSVWPSAIFPAGHACPKLMLSLQCKDLRD